MAIAVGQPCPLCHTPMKALGTTTYCPDEDKHGADDFSFEAITEELFTHCPFCNSLNVTPKGPPTMFGSSWHRCNACNLDFIP